MKKRYDDLSLYSEAENFYVQEMDAKKDKMNVGNKTNFSISFEIIIYVSLLSISSFFWDKNFQLDIKYIINTIISSLLIILPIFTVLSFFFYFFVRKKYDLFILSLYKNISTYNSNPIKVVYWIFGNIFIFAIIFWYMLQGVDLGDSKEFVLGSSIEYSFKNSLSIFGESSFSEIINNFLNKESEYTKKLLFLSFIFYSYFQKLFSLLLVLLFGLSLRRKFRR